MSTFMISYDPERFSIQSILNIVKVSGDRHAVPFKGTVLIKTSQSFNAVLLKLRSNNVVSLITPVTKDSLDGVLSDWATIHRSVF
jgi:hypothetical protein